MAGRDIQDQEVKSLFGTPTGQIRRGIKRPGQSNPVMDLKVAASREREESIEEKAGAMHPKLKGNIGGALQTEKRRAGIERAYPHRSMRYHDGKK